MLVKKKLIEITNQEIEAIYDSGKEATVSFIRTLVDKINDLAGLYKIVEKQQEEINQLKAIINKDSHNSNRPPSSDNPFKKKTKSLRKKSGKKPGGQKGHKGSKLQKVSNPDKTEKVSHHDKCDCGKNLKNAKVIEVITKQLFDLILSPLFVTEYRGEIKECNCGKIHYPEFPKNIKNETQYGSNIKAFTVYLKQYGFISYDRISELFKDIFNIEISQGTLVNFVNECSKNLEPVVCKIKEKLQKSDVCHFDESGLRIEGKLNWLHTAGTNGLTYYYPHSNRGYEAMISMGILPYFTGVAIHDGWKSYSQFINCLHGLCNQHHLRELTFFEEKDEKWAKKIKDCLLSAKKEKDKQSYIPEKRYLAYKNRLRRLIYEGIKLHPEKRKTNRNRGRPKQSKEFNLLRRLRDNIDSVLCFLKNPSVPFTNNRAEQDVRMVKIQQKVSGTFRSIEGAFSFCITRSYISSLKKCSNSVFEALASVWSTNIILPTALMV